ncbi:regulation of mitochondrial mRNA stability [Mactra antiquata]
MEFLRTIPAGSLAIKSLTKQNISTSVLRRKLKLLSCSIHSIEDVAACSSKHFVRWSSSDSKSKKKVKIRVEKEELVSFLSQSDSADEIYSKEKESQEDDIKDEKTNKENDPTKLPPLIEHAMRCMYVGNTTSFTKLDHLSFDAYSEVRTRRPMSKALQSFCFKMEVPYDIVNGFSAADALKKICEMAIKGNNIFVSENHSHIINELVNLLKTEIQFISGKTTIDFLFYHFVVEHFPQVLFHASVRRLNRAMNQDEFTETELMDIVARFQSLDTSKSKVIMNIWNHISRRAFRATASNLCRMYKEAPVDHINIFTKLHPELERLIDSLNISDVQEILNVQQTTYQSEKLLLISKWMALNIDNISANDYEIFMSCYLKSDCVCSVMTENISKIVNAVNKKDTMTSKLICQLASYCRKALHYNEEVLETACRHYILNSENYTAENVHGLLEAIGVLNYLPVDQRTFFTKIENFLMKNFYSIEVSMLLEMFVYLIYLDKVAVNFESYIFAPLFLGIVNDFKGEKRTKAIRNLSLIEKAFEVKGFECTMSFPYDYKESDPVISKQCTKILYDTLHEVFTDTNIIKLENRPTYMSDCALCFNDMDLAVWADVEIPETKTKFIMLPMDSDSFCKNNPTHMIGYEATNIRILRDLGHTVAQFNADKIEQLVAKKQLSLFLKSLFMRQVIDRVNQPVKEVNSDVYASPTADGYDDKYTTDNYDDDDLQHYFDETP